MFDVPNPTSDMLGSTLRLVHGIRNEEASGEGGRWRELTTRILCGDWPARERSDLTKGAEAGLGVNDKPYYFYVMRTEKQFGRVVFVLAEAVGAQWPSDVYGTTPFDSGGWWLGAIKTKPPLDRPTRTRMFRDLDRPLEEWQSAFHAYITHAYATSPMLNYVRGKPPEVGCVPEIVLAHQNRPRAWTWEVRIPQCLIAGRVKVLSAYMDDDDKSNYIDWVENDDWAVSNFQEEQRDWAVANIYAPTDDQMVVDAVENRLIEEVSL